MQRWHGRGKHTHSGAWAIRSRHKRGGSTQSNWCRTWISLSTRHWCQPTWPCCSSYALALEQPDEEYIGRLRESISEFKASSARLRLPYYLSLLAQVYGKAGRAEEGLACIYEALAEARIHNERWWDAELHRLRGEFLLLGSADAVDGEAAILRAISIAQSQQARSLELRATMSLARLWSAQKRYDDARRQLRDVYTWFTEGCETPDLQAARLLLAQL